MKLPYWSNPNNNISIIEPTVDDMNRYGHNYIGNIIVLSKEHIEALNNGKMLAWDDSEYTTFVKLKDE